MRVYHNFDLTDFNSYRLKAHCRTAYFPETDQDIAELFSEGKQDRVLIGAGYNILLTKDYYDQDFIIFANTYDAMQLINANHILCEAGCDMKVLSEFALKNSLTGLEIFYDIPSSLGGAVVMNAGAGGEDIRALLVSVEYYDPFEKTIKTITKEDIGFEYRNSFFQKNPDMVVCRALLHLQSGNADDIKNKMEAVKAARWAKQPRDYPNAGSVYKRPPGRFVGPMIDELGLKGYTVGGARVSEKHSGFIINFNNAKGTDISELIAYVKGKVLEKFEVDLEVEQRII